MSPEIQAMRERIFQGKVNTAQLCAIFGRGPRAISRWISHGLPHTRIGTMDWFDLEKVADWIGATTERQHGGPRLPGRPRFFGAGERQYQRRRRPNSPKPEPPLDRGPGQASPRAPVQAGDRLSAGADSADSPM
jgi:hypothetical protein